MQGGLHADLRRPAGLSQIYRLPRAEAVHFYQRGFRWWPDAAFEREIIAPEQEARYEADAGEDQIRSFLTGKQRTTVLDVAQRGLKIELPRIGTADQRRIAAALERLGWARGRRTATGRWWVAPSVRHDAPLRTL